MLTPPYHFAIVAAPLGTNTEDEPHILYRGSLPAARNAPFIRRLGLRTLVCMRKKPLKDDEPLARWAAKRGIDVRWIKAEKMGEESLGMERGEVSEVLKILLNPAAYPIYLADVDGISHTTLVVAALRKLQGWNAESIVNEIYRFEPDHDDFPLVPFITSYLSTTAPSKDDPGAALALPAPPYPIWLWPDVQQPGVGRAAPPPATRSERVVSSASVSSTGSAGQLPFPNPLTARRHPSMRLTFTAVPAQTGPVSAGPSRAQAMWRSPSNTLTRVTTADARMPRERADTRESKDSRDRDAREPRDRDADVRDESPTSSREASGSAAELRHKVSFGGAGALTRSPILTRRLSNTDQTTSPEQVMSPLDEDDDDYAIGDEEDDDDVIEEEEEEDDDDDMDEDDDDDEDDEEEEEDEPPMSQYISALDLAGFG